MTVLKHDVRRGAYHDSIVLMQLQGALKELDGVIDGGAVMATEANLAILAANELRPDAFDADAEDLLVVVRAVSEETANEALEKVGELLVRRHGEASDDYRPKSLEAAIRTVPDARWVLISVPGRFAKSVAEKALDLGRHVFLYSDNVSLGDEAELKRRAAEKGLLVLGPDCGTATINGVGFGFANRVRRGGVGIVAASGTGLQAIASRLHALGGGVSQAIGTGGRDLSKKVGATTALQALDLLARDPETRVIIVVSKPPEPAVAAHLLAAARATGKPVVIAFQGYPPPGRRQGPLHFATSLGEAAELAAEIEARPVADEATRGAVVALQPPLKLPPAPYLRGLFSGGTLALEALQGLRAGLEPLASNLKLPGVELLDDPSTSRAHTVVDLGDDALTVGRAHPMIDPELLLRRLAAEAADSEVGLLLFDVVLGDGSHPDPASRLAPAVKAARRDRRNLEVVAIVVGTEEDPQGLDDQIERLEDAGALVFEDVGAAVEHAIARLAVPPKTLPAVDLDDLLAPVTAINVGLEAFYESLLAQAATAVQVDWKPPAGGDEKLLAILEKMKS